MEPDSKIKSKKYDRIIKTLCSIQANFLRFSFEFHESKSIPGSECMIFNGSGIIIWLRADPGITTLAQNLVMSSAVLYRYRTERMCEKATRVGCIILC